MRLSLIGLILLTFALIVGCSGKKEKTHCNIGIAKFKTPEGWEPTEGERNVVVNLTPVDATPETLTQIISVEIFKCPPETKLLDAAAAYAGKWQGEVHNHPMAVAGENALHISVPKRESLAPTDCFVVLHEGYALEISGGSVGDVNVLPTLEKIVETWQWLDPDEAK